MLKDRLKFFGMLIILSSICWTLEAQVGQKWNLVEEDYRDQLSLKLFVLDQPNPALDEWIRLEIENQRDTDLVIASANYKFELRVYEPGAKSALKEGFFSTQNPAEVMETFPSPNLVSETILPPGKWVTSKSISAYAATFLGYPTKAPWQVKSNVTLEIKLSDGSPIRFYWPEIEFSFFWNPAPPEVLAAKADFVRQNMSEVSFDNHTHQWLGHQLANPELKASLTAAEVIAALKVRTGNEDGKLALLQYIHQQRADDPLVVAYFSDALRKKDPAILDDLAAAPNVWQTDFLELLIDWFHEARPGVRYRIMDILHLHQETWKKKKDIPRILTDLLHYQYEEIIYERHEALSDRQLLQWSTAASMLGKTGNADLLPDFCSFLACKKRIIDSGILLDANSLDFPRPLRVCDVALEAMLLLEGQSLEKVYFKAGYTPPYEYGEAELIITRIRDQLIQKIQQKKVCQP